MLEIRTAYGDPNLPSADELNRLYGIFLRDEESRNGTTIYVPLQLSIDTATHSRVAFYGKMLYQPGGAWHPQQVRLAWAVQVLNDICDTNDASAKPDESGNCTKYSALNQPEIIHRYYDDYVLAGLRVKETQGYEVATIWQDPARYDPEPYPEASLYMLAHALESTFLAGRDQGDDGSRDITLAELERRFNRTTNGDIPEVERWGIDNVLRVETLHFAHRDAGLAQLAITDTVRVLEENFAARHGITPTLMFASEEVYREVSLEHTAAGTGAEWAADDGPARLVLGLGGDGGGEPLLITEMNWMPYRYDGASGQWTTCPISDYWDYLSQRGAAETVNGGTGAASAGGTGSPLDARSLEDRFWEVYYLVLYEGHSALGPVTGVQGAWSDVLPSDVTLQEQYASQGGFDMLAARVLARMAPETLLDLSKLSRKTNGLDSGVLDATTERLQQPKQPDWRTTKVRKYYEVGGAIGCEIAATALSAVALFAPDLDETTQTVLGQVSAGLEGLALFLDDYMSATQELAELRMIKRLTAGAPLDDAQRLRKALSTGTATPGKAPGPGALIVELVVIGVMSAIQAAMSAGSLSSIGWQAFGAGVVAQVIIAVAVFALHAALVALCATGVGAIIAVAIEILIAIADFILGFFGESIAGYLAEVLYGFEQMVAPSVSIRKHQITRKIQAWAGRQVTRSPSPRPSA